MCPEVRKSIFRSFPERYVTFFLLHLVVLSGVCQVAAQTEAPSQSKVSESEVQAVILAVKDEIYAMRYSGYYLDIGKSGKDVPIYIAPYVEKGLIWTIYRLLPHGEVYRAAYVRKDGLAILLGDPHNGFPPTQGASMKTVYLSDEDVIEMKTTWRKYYFSVDIKPSQKEIQEAKRRQELRYTRKQ